MFNQEFLKQVKIKSHRKIKKNDFEDFKSPQQFEPKIA